MNKQILTYQMFGKHLRLSNMLYQYFFLLYCEQKYNREIILPDYYLWKYLKHPPKIANDIKGEEVFHFPDDSICKDYVEEFFIKNKDKSIEINLNPFAQSFSWTNEIRDYTLHKMEFKDEEVDKIKNQYKHFLDKPCIGISIRLGKDFVDNGNFYIPSKEFYIGALNKYFPNWKTEYNVVVFSDNIKEAQEYVFPDQDFKYAEYNKTHIQLFDSQHYHSEHSMNHLILGSLMNNFIISASTFSMFQGFFCQHRKDNKEGVIIHSGKNLINEYLQNTKNNDNYYPQNWIKYE